LLDNSRYRISRAIKAGGMGAVYLAQDSRLADQDCAIKEMIVSPLQTPEERAESDAWFTREALLLASLRHPMIPRISNHFSEAGRRYLVMDFIDGQDLESALAAHHGPCPTNQVVAWASALGDALSYLHRQQPPIIFRDLKPANIMLTPQGALMLVDFGIARSLHNVGGTRGAVTVIGTPGYVPPEQYQGLAEPRSDQYALAATLHHLLTNRDPQHAPPFVFPPVRQLAPSVPLHVELALTRALSMAASDRYPSTQEFLAALGVAMAEVGAPIGLATRPTGAVADAGQGLAGTRMIRVAPDGSGDVRTLEEAVQYAAPDAVIRLAAGEHWLGAPLTLSQAVTLVGEGRDRTRVICEAAEYVLRCAGPGPVVLRDLTVAHTGGQAANVVDVAGGAIECINCRCTGAVHDQQLGGSGLCLYGAASGRVYRCEMIANGAVGIAVLDRAQPTLVENTCTGNDHGIVVAGEAQPSLEANICRENTTCGISYLGTSTGTARQNTCTGNDHGIAVGGEAQPTLQANICRENTTCGISYIGTSTGTARQNTCTGNERGIVVTGAAQPSLEANICVENRTTGIIYSHAAGGVARQNTCTRNDFGIGVGGEAQPTLEANICRENTTCGISYIGTSTGTARQNTCTGNERGIGVGGEAQPTLEANICRENTGFGICYAGILGGTARQNTCSGNEHGIGVGVQAQPALEANTCSLNT
jgi:parallel beta-helix repeat protein